MSLVEDIDAKVIEAYDKKKYESFSSEIDAGLNAFSSITEWSGESDLV
jgi:hypothetical protein